MPSSKISYGRVKTSYSLKPESREKIKAMRRMLRMGGFPVTESDILEILIMEAEPDTLVASIARLSR